MVFHLIISFVTAITISTKTLPQAIKEAWSRSEEVRISRLQLEKSELKVDEYWSTFGPTVLGYWSYQRNPEIKASFTAKLPSSIKGLMGSPQDMVVRPSENRLWGVHLTQKIFDPAMIPGLKITYKYKEMAQLGLEETKEKIAQVVAKLYLTLIYLKKQERILEEEQKALEKDVERAKEEVKLGIQPPWSKIRIELQVQRYEKEVIAIKSAIENVKKELFRLTGEKFEVVTPPSIPESLPEFQSLDINNSTSLKLLNVNLKLARLMKKVRIGRFFPRLDFIWDYSYQANPGTFSKKDNWYVMLKLSWTIFSGGSRYFQLRQSYLDEDVATLQIQKERKENEIKMKKLLNDYKSLVKLLRIAEESLKLANENFKMVKESYHLGKADIISYLDARSNLIRARAEVLQAKNQLILKRMEIYIQVGKLDQFLKELER